MSGIQLIQAQEVDFVTQANAAWLDGLPIVAQAGLGAVVPGLNTGNGSLAVSAVGAGTPYGAHILRITDTAGFAVFSVEAPDGIVTTRGVLGAPVFAGGLSMVLTPGTVAFKVGDAFAVTVIPYPVDLTGLRFDLQTRRAPGARAIEFDASSAPADGTQATILHGGPAGTVAMAVPSRRMAPDRFPPGDYVYDILATDPDTGLVVPAYFGRHTHRAGVSLLT